MNKYKYLTLIVYFLILSNIKSENYLSIDVKAFGPDMAQLYFDTGSGISESNSRKCNYNGTGEFERLKFSIPSDNINVLRFDPGQKSEYFEIRNSSINFDVIHKSVPLNQIKVIDQIARLDVQDDILSFYSMPGSSDPQLGFPTKTSNYNLEEHNGFTQKPILNASDMDSKIEKVGVLDQLSIENNILTARGWAGCGDIKNNVKTVKISVNEIEIFNGVVDTYNRPDLAKVKGLSWGGSGWFIKTPVSISFPQNVNNIKVIATLDDDSMIDLIIPSNCFTNNS
jgi:hypothetical protein